MNTSNTERLGNTTQTTEGSGDYDTSEPGSPSDLKLEMDNNPSRSSSSSNGSLDANLHQSKNDDNNQVIAEHNHEDNLFNEDNKNTPSRSLPAINAPEKIILCVDMSESPDATPFKLGDGTSYTPFCMIKRIVEIFVFSKSSINKNHEFALVGLRGEETLWLTDFTKDPRPLIKELNKCVPLLESDVFNMSELFDVLQENLTLPPQSYVEVPDFVPRVILIYSRSNCVPKFNEGRVTFNKLIACPFITLDLLYIHEDVSKDNKCEEIYNQLMELDHQSYSYIFHAVRNPKILHDNMAKLLAHPLQRPVQKKAVYKLEQKSNLKLND